MRKLADIGFDVLEVSGTATNAERDMRKEGDFVKRATDLGFAVFGEVGKKFSNTTKRGAATKSSMKRSRSRRC